jgi:LmbE family N-acetylglucosaminyl deacetylase
VSSIWRPVRERDPARSLMVVVAHPGDEAFGFAGAIATSAAEGAYVVVVCATRGYFDRRLRVKSPAPGGRNRDVTQPVGWRNLDTVREDEMRRSVAVLGVRVLRMLDYAEDELASADFDLLTGRIVETIRMHRPEVVLTFGPDGVSGDSDPVVLSRAVSAAVAAAAQPLAYEDDLEEDQVGWRIAKLYHLVVPTASLGGRAPDAGYGSPSADGTVAVGLGELAPLKLAAISRHISQTGSEGPFHGWDPADREAYLSAEYYRLALTNVLETGGSASLFDGLS